MFEKKIKPIETLYKGYKFRSRLEARWAVFFDECGIEWEYELEGYELSNGLFYLPDFYLPKMNTFFEVKGAKKYEDISYEDRLKIECFIKDGNRIAIGYSDMTFQACSGEGINNNGQSEWRLEKEKEESCIARCPNCNEYTFYGLTGSWFCGCCEEHIKAYGLLGDLSNAYDHSEISIPIIKAKQARFEHGEGGK